MRSEQHSNDHLILAQCKVCRVERCGDCDTVHLHVGHTSLRLTSAAFLSLSATLLEASHALVHGAMPTANPNPVN